MSDEEVPVLSRPERMFKNWSPWIGVGIFFVGMFYALEKGAEVHWSIFAVGGVLMGVGKTMSALKGVNLS